MSRADGGERGPELTKDKHKSITNDYFGVVVHRRMQMPYFSVGNDVGLPKSPILGHHAPLEI